MRTLLSRRAVIGSVGAALSVAGCLDSSDPSGSTGEQANDSTEDQANEANASEAGSSETEEVTFQSTADTEIEGTVYGSSDCGVVLTPQINLDRESWEEQARRFVENDYLALAIDEDEDNRPESVLGAARYLTEDRDLQRIVLIGASSGGEASVVANARADTDAVAGVVALSPGGGTESAADLQGQKLFVVAEDDDERFVQTTEELHERAPEPKQLRMYSGSEHGQSLFDGDHQEDLLERILTLVASACDRP